MSNYTTEIEKNQYKEDPPELCGRTELRGNGFLERVNFAPRKVCEPAKKENKEDHGSYYSLLILYVKQYPIILLHLCDMVFCGGLGNIINIAAYLLFREIYGTIRTVIQMLWRKTAYGN